MGIKLALEYAVEMLTIAQDSLEDDSDDLCEIAKVKLYRGMIKRLASDPIILNCIDSRLNSQADMIPEAEPIEDKGVVLIRR